MVGIKNWLLDVHALLYQQGENQSDKIDLLRGGEYDQLLSERREERSNATNGEVQKRIDLTMEMVWNKLNDVELSRRVTGKGLKLQAASLSAYKDKAAQVFRGQKGSEA